MRGVDGVAGLGRVKFLRVKHWQNDAACQAAAGEKDDDLLADLGCRQGARAAGAPGGPFDLGRWCPGGSGCAASGRGRTGRRSCNACCRSPRADARGTG